MSAVDSIQTHSTAGPTPLEYRMDGSPAGLHDSERGSSPRRQSGQRSLELPQGEAAAHAPKNSTLWRPPQGPPPQTPSEGLLPQSAWHGPMTGGGHMAPKASFMPSAPMAPV